MKRFFLPLVFLGLAACQQTQASSPTASDLILRSFLDVKTLAGSYKLPEGNDIFLVTWLEIEDGKLLRHGGISYNNVQHREEGRVVEAEIVWGERNGETRVALASSGVAVGKSEFWKVFDKSWAASSFTKEVPHPTFEGYTILGFVMSDLKQDGTNEASFPGTFEAALKAKKYIGALVLKSFKTQEELDQYSNKESH